MATYLSSLSTSTPYGFVDSITTDPSPTRRALTREHIKDKIRSIDAEQIGLISFQIMEIAATYLDIDQKELNRVQKWVQKTITHYFSLPSYFVEEGLCFQIQEDVGLSIPEEKTSQLHGLFLKLDEKLIKEKAKLAFILSEESKSIVFQKKPFTIEELEFDFLSKQ